MVGIFDKEWMEIDETGGVVKKTVRYTIASDEGSKDMAVEVDISILPGTRYAQYQDAMVERDAMGEVNINTDAGTTKLISMSTGLSMEQVDAIRRKKPMAFWTGLITVCNEVNSPTSKKVEVEKNVDGQV